MLLLLHLLWAGSLAQDGRFHLQIQRPVTVEEGLCVQVPCSVFYPNYGLNSSTPAYGYWFRDGADVNLDAPVATNNPDRKVQKETQGRFRLVGNPHIYDCSLEIGEAQKGDTGTYFFRVERGHFVRYTYLENKLSVHVAALTQTPNIHIQGILEVDHPKKITCTVPWTCKKETPPTFSWIGVDLTSLGPKAPHSSVLILTPKLHHHGTNLTCQVTLSGVGVTMKRTIPLNVSYAPKNLTIRAFHGNRTVPEVLSNASLLRVPEGQFLRLVCGSDSNPPARLSWTRGSLTLNPSQPLNVGVLDFPHVVCGDGGEFICQAQHLLGSCHVSVRLSVQGASCSCPHVSGEQRGSWPLVLTLLRGALMGFGFLFTYVLTSIYYTRFRGPQGSREAKSG